MCASFHEKGCNNCAVVYKFWIGPLDRNLALFLSWKTHIWLDLPTVAKLLMATSYIFSHLENWTMGQRFQLSLSQQDAQWQLIVSDYCKSIMQLSSKVKVSFTLMSQSLIVSIVRENGGLQRNKKKKKDGGSVKHHLWKSGITVADPGAEAKPTLGPAIRLWHSEAKKLHSASMCNCDLVIWALNPIPPLAANIIWLILWLQVYFIPELKLEALAHSVTTWDRHLGATVNRYGGCNVWHN